MSDSSRWEIPSLGLSRVRLDQLLQELLDRVGDVLTTQERLRALLDAVLVVGSDLDLRSVLERIVESGCRLSGARYGVLGVVGRHRELAEFITHGISAEERARIGALPRGRGILGLLIDEPRPIRLRRLGDHAKSYGFPPNHPPMTTFLGVPVRVRDQVFGNLYLTEKTGGGEFTVEDEELVVALAAAAAVAIDNARLFEQARRRQAWLEASAEISNTLLGKVDKAAALTLVARLAREVSGAHQAAIVLADPDDPQQDPVVEVVDGGGLEGLVGVRRPGADSSVAEVIATGRHELIEDLGPGGRGFLRVWTTTSARCSWCRSARGGPCWARWSWAGARTSSWRGLATTFPWYAASPPRPHSRSSRSAPRRSGSACWFWRTGIGSPATCTTWSSSGCSGWG
jgi:GAF domain-containing protein